MTRRMTLALRVFGRSRRTRSRFGRSGLPSRVADERVELARRASVASRRGRGGARRSRPAPAPWSRRARRSPRPRAPPDARRAPTPLRPGRAACRAILIVSSERPRMYQSPSSSIAAQSPWTQTPGKARPVGLLVALRIAPEAARHADPRRAHDQLADLVAHRPPLLVDDVGGDARAAGRRTQHGFSGVSTLPATRPPETSVPPE